MESTVYQVTSEGVSLGKVLCEGCSIGGRSDETRISVFSTENRNIDGIFNVKYMGGVIDGHSSPGVNAGKLAEEVTVLFCNMMESVHTRGGIERAIEIAVDMVQDRISPEAINYGVCGIIFMMTSEKLYLVRVGDGNAMIEGGLLFSTPKRGHFVNGNLERLTVGNSWGDRHFKEDCQHPCFADVVSYPLKSLRGKRLLITDDGLFEMTKYVGKSLLQKIMQFGIEKAVSSIVSAMRKYDAEPKNVEDGRRADDIGLLMLHFPR